MSVIGPVLASQVQFASDRRAAVQGWLSASITASHWYYFISPRTAVADGQSLLQAIQDALNASHQSTQFTVYLNSDLKVCIANSGGACTAELADYASLGFVSYATLLITGVTTAPNRPRWLWAPEMLVSTTGPVNFDPNLDYGVPSSVGASQRAPDMSAAYTSNGVQWEADYTFNGIQGHYKIYPQGDRPNEDWIGFWKQGPALGRRILWWRNAARMIGAAPPGGSLSPYNCIEYTPNDELGRSPGYQQTSPNNLVYWDLKLGLWVTENGEAPPA